MKSRMPLSLLALSAALLSACSSSTLSTLPLASGNTLYYINQKPVTVDADYVDRYACTRSVMVCTSTGRVASTVSCRCP